MASGVRRLFNVARRRAPGTKDRRRDGEQSDARAGEEILIVRLERRISLFQRSNERLHQSQLAAEDFQISFGYGLPQGAQSQSINWMLLHAVDEDQGVGVDGPGGGQDQRSHASRSSWNRRSTSSHVGALRGPEGKESRNSSTERRDGIFDGRGTKQTSTSWPSCSPNTVELAVTYCRGGD